ncbi:uncharacterized protein At4g06744-like isoform X2 [Rosa rugosa]|uniref:uncharacterized protein At4g06744-like isoform X2 n=1 Tax=Rosa rugosa TaxID=74645 RepID=UPI002B4107D6|nr:uncharacterized protein At4g06744-like isoform X2 [Rosa rugosa]
MRRSASTKALFLTFFFFLLTCLIANSATHNITRRSSKDKTHRKKCPITSSLLQCSKTPPPPPPDLPNPQKVLSFADQRLQVVYPVIQKFKSIITSDPLNITKTWVGSDICRYKGFYCDNPPYNLSAIALASIDFNGFQLGASSLDGFLDQLPDIALFHANSNNFSGTISSKIANLCYLYELDISNNLFSGPFPTAVLGMNGLTFLDIRFNFFTGSVPPQIFTQDLDALFLNNNNFMQSLPDNLGSSHIILLTLANNNFNGPIPSSIAKALSSLTEVLLLNNQLTDKVEQLSFAGNLLFGLVPEVICDQLLNLANFSLSNNYFFHVGPICQSLIQRGLLDVTNNCIPGLPFQRSVEECADFFAYPMFCPNMGSYTYIPCKCRPLLKSQNLQVIAAMSLSRVTLFAFQRT